MVEASVSPNELRQILTQLHSHRVVPTSCACFVLPTGCRWSSSFQHPSYLPIGIVPTTTTQDGVHGSCVPTGKSARHHSIVFNCCSCARGSCGSNTLLKSGLVSAIGTPAGAGETAKTDKSKSEPMDVARASAREYHKANQNVGRGHSRSWFAWSL
jgi:hypothetical protein